MVGVILNEKQLFKTSVGPAFAGGLSVIAAILSRLLPDSTSIEMLKTQQEITRIVNDPETAKKLVSQGLDPVGSSHAEFVRFYEEEIAKNAKLIASVGMEVR